MRDTPSRSVAKARARWLLLPAAGLVLLASSLHGILAAGLLLWLAAALYAQALAPDFAPPTAAGGERLGFGALAAASALGLYTLWVGLVVGTPAAWLREDDSPLHALLLSAGFLLALLPALRLWPVFGLLMRGEFRSIDDMANMRPADPRPVGIWLSRLQGVWRLTARLEEADFGRAIAAASALLLLAVLALLLAGQGAWIAPVWRQSLAIGYALLLCPAAEALLLWLGRHLLADSEPDTDPIPELVPEVKLAQAPTARDRAGSAPSLPPVPDHNSTLLNAAASGNVTQALELLRAGADPNATPGLNDRDQRSAMMSASTLPDLRLLRELIARGGDPNLAVNGMTPLLIAVRDTRHGRPDAVMTLLANGANSESPGPDGNTALHYAASTVDPSIAAMLLDAGAPIDAVNNEGWSALGLAARAGNLPVLNLLLERGARVEPARGLSALLAAASAISDAPALTRRLLKARADVGAADKLGRTALHVAALHGHAETVELLLTAGAAIDARDAQGVTALMEAARAGANRVLQRLVFRKPDASGVDHVGRSALHIACQSRTADVETLRALLGIGVDPEVKNREGKRAIDLAAQAGRWQMVAVLDPNWPLPEVIAATDTGSTEQAPKPVPIEERLRLLAESLRQGRLLIASELLALDPPLPIERLRELLTACLGEDSAPACRLLLKAGLDPNAQPAAPLNQVIRGTPLPLQVIECLLEAAAQPGGGALLPLLGGAETETEARRRQRIETIALALLARGADPFASDAKGWGLLHHAASAPWPGLLAEGLRLGLDPNARDRRGATPLVAAICSRDRESLARVQILLAHGADPERPAADGETPLGLALALGRHDLARWLRWGPWRLPKRRLRPGDLAAAAGLGDLEAVRRLLTLGQPVDGRDTDGCTALLRAAGGGYAAVLECLLAHGADPGISADSGATALSAAVSAGNDALVTRLIAGGAAVDQRIVNGITPLMLAAALGRESIVGALLLRGASPDDRDAHAATALHAAVQFAWASENAEPALGIIGRLLDAGTEIDARDQDGATPLLLLLGGRIEAGQPAWNPGLPALVQALLARGADVDAQDRRGVSPLHAAAMHGLLEITETLLAKGADLGRRDLLARDARDVAILLGYVDLAARLKRV